MNILFYTGYMHFMYSEFCFFFFKRGKGVERSTKGFVFAENLLVCSAGLGHRSHLPTRGDLELSHTNSELGMPFPPAWKIKSKLRMPEQGFQRHLRPIVSVFLVLHLLFLPPTCMFYSLLCHDRISILQMTQPYRLSCQNVFWAVCQNRPYFSLLH